MYDRQRCNEKWKSKFLRFNLIEIINDGWLVFSFVHMPGKTATPLKPLLEGGRGRLGRNMYDRQRCCEM